MSLLSVLVRGARCVSFLAVRAQTALRHKLRSHGGRPPAVDAGQTTAEYALVLVGAVAVALLPGELFDAVFDHIVSKVQ